VNSKQVFVNDAMIGEAQTWADVDRLLRENDLRFDGEPRAAEGPTAFYLNGIVAVGPHEGSTPRTTSDSR
jgi:hypothetical protein